MNAKENRMILRDVVELVTVLAAGLVWVLGGTFIVIGTYTVGGFAGAFIAVLVFAGATAWLLEEIRDA